ncbi:Conserved oligomeric Golgi complex subunit 7 [Leucoagaricus sp. SymC.cos]|nr:Conserved oligomeric Golgi complex subunit 7 [Leucoagaricus sp. SymC.cos]
MLTSTTQVVDSIEQYNDVVSWINDTLASPDDFDDLNPTNLIELDQQITQLLTSLDIASEDSSTQLEHIIDDVSRGIPRLAYDLHFMKDGALTLQNNLVEVLHKARATVPPTTDTVLRQLNDLDLIKNRMESAREVLREAESWSTLELEVTSLIAEKNYAKAAERLSEASKSMVVFQNTSEYDPRRNLMVNLQNQLEASLSSALVSAINAQDVANCKEYFAIFSVIQRESEFRNYYYAARRSNVINVWQSARLMDCEEPHSGPGPSQEVHQPFTNFLNKFYNAFSSMLNVERTPICSIFPDPAMTLSSFIASTLSSLQPTFPQTLNSLSNRQNNIVLGEFITALHLTEDFAAAVDKIMEKVKFAAGGPMSPRTNNAEKPTHVRRRSNRMSISWRPGQSRSLSGSGGGAIQQALSQMAEVMEWEQELFQPFLDFQIDYGSLEKRFLDHSLAEITAGDSQERIEEVDRPRLLRERAVDIFGLAEGSMGRCSSFTHGYGAVGLVWALDNFFKSFMELWITELQAEMSQTSSPSQTLMGDADLAGMDYSAHDWSNIQLCLHLLSSSRAVSERLVGFEAKLRSYLSQVATQFNMAREDPINFSVCPVRGENQLLEQSTLNSAELRTLLQSVASDPTYSRPGYSHPSHEPLLVNARRSLSLFAQTCQSTLQRTILSPLRQHLSSYSSLSLWSAAGDPRLKPTTTETELNVPTFSLPPSDTMQKVAEGLLNFPRLFEVYADDDALSFSLQTLPHLDYEMLKGFTEQSVPDTPAVTSSSSHMRRASVSFTTKTTVVDPETVTSAWLLSLGHTFLGYVVQDVLPTISFLSTSGAAQLASDLEYLTNIVRALNVEHEILEQWRLYSEMDEEEMKAKLKEKENMDSILIDVARLRGLN